MPAPSTSPPAPRDFPEWMDPMLVKELRQALQHRFFLIPFIAVHFIMLGALAVEWIAIQKTAAAAASATSAFIPPVFGKIAFWGAVYLMVAYLMPLRGFDALHEERQRGNAELMLMAGLTRWKIVRGKWMVQVFLTLLVISSLLPYAIVRYFFGGIEFTENLVQLIGVLGCSLANSGLVIGASGYSSYTVRLSILCTGLFYIFWVVVATNTMALDVTSLVGTSRVNAVMFIYILLYIIGVFLLYAVLGLQLGRAHLKLYLVPWEPAPTRTMAGLIIVSPFILLSGTLATCGWGGVFVIAILVYSLIIFDRPVAGPASGGKPTATPSGY